MLCAVIPPIVGTFVPIKAYLLLRCTAAEPMVPQVHEFQLVGYQGIIYHPNGCSIVCLNECGGLRPSYFNKGLVEGQDILGGDKVGVQFCLGG